MEKNTFPGGESRVWINTGASNYDTAYIGILIITAQRNTEYIRLH